MYLYIITSTILFGFLINKCFTKKISKYNLKYYKNKWNKILYKK